MKYHKYVFDLENRKFIGDFETMYRNEKNENFDSWHQDDSRQLQRQLALSIVNAYNFNRILDIGCGKGALTHFLKKRNNHVTAVDISETAINTARERYPDIEFYPLNVSNLEEFKKFFLKKTFDLVFISEVLSYLENWEEVLQIVAKHCEYLLINLYIPNNPIGFVKSSEKLVNTISKNFDLCEVIEFKKSLFTVAFAKSYSYVE